MADDSKEAGKDRRDADRRGEAGGNYDGPERRSGERRQGERRKTPRS
jgi:hypothetical protein